VTPPATITILGFAFTVALEDAHDFELAGLIEHNRQRIRVKHNLAPDETRETLLHEVIHGVASAAAVDLSERKVRALSRVLYATLRENPELVTYLTEP